MSVRITIDSNLSGGVSSTGGSSIGSVVVVLLEIITVPLLNSWIPVSLLGIIVVLLLNSVTSGGSSMMDVVPLESIVVPSLNSGISERSPGGGVAGGPWSSGSCANALPQ